MRRYRHKCLTKQLIFYSTFSLSSQYFIQCFLSLLTDLSLSNPCSPSLSSLDQIPSPSNQRYGGVVDCGSSHPHRSSRHHRFSFKDSIATNLKTPLSSVWCCHCHLGLKLPCRFDLNPSQPWLEPTTLVVWCTSQPWREANLSHYYQSKATTADKESCSFCCPWGERKTLRVWMRLLFMGPRVCIPKTTVSCQLWIGGSFDWSM